MRTLPAAAWTVVRRTPFTLAMLVLLVVVGLWSGILAHRVSADILAPWAYAPTDLGHPAEWWRLIVSCFVTEGGRAFWEAALGIVIFVGASEWRTGTAWAALTFWGAHLGALLIESLLVALPASWLGLPMGDELAASAGVGASAGFVGCLGLLTATLPRRWSRLAAAGIALVLVVMMVYPVGEGDRRAVWITDGIAHLVAFVLGFVPRDLWRRRTRNQLPPG